MRLIDLFSDIFSYMAHLIHQPDPARPSFESVQNQLDRLFSELDDKGRAAGLRMDQIEEAKFAVCAWVDETILCSPWEGKKNWLKAPLQRRLFNTANAGEEFLARLKKLTPEQDAEREVYSLCLALGFTGPYYQEAELAGLDDLKRKTFRKLAGADFDEPGCLGNPIFPESYPTRTPTGKPVVNNRWRKRSLLLIAGFAAGPVLVAVLYLFFQAILDSAVVDFFSTAGP